MPRKQPVQVVDGVRSPGNAFVPATEQAGDGYVSSRRIEELEDARAAARPARGPMVEYQSRNEFLRWSKEINHDLIIDGRVVRKKDQTIQFQRYIYRTDDPEIIAWIESRPNYGVGRAVWRTQDLTDALMLDSVDKTIEMLRSAARVSPNAIEALAKKLGNEDFNILQALTAHASEKEPVEKTA